MKWLANRFGVTKMFRNAALIDGVVTNLDDSCVQPNAVDLRLDTVQRIADSNFILQDDARFKLTRDMQNIEPVSWNSTNFFHKMGKYASLGSYKSMFELEQGSYQFETKHKVTIPEGMAGWLIARSTLNRNGIFITSGLYDSGFSNFIGGVMHVMTGHAKIERGARIAQFILADAETAHLYDGQYNAAKT